MMATAIKSNQSKMIWVLLGNFKFVLQRILDVYSGNTKVILNENEKPKDSKFLSTQVDVIIDFLCGFYDHKWFQS